MPSKKVSLFFLSDKCIFIWLPFKIVSLGFPEDRASRSRLAKSSVSRFVKETHCKCVLPKRRWRYAGRTVIVVTKIALETAKRELGHILRISFDPIGFRFTGVSR